MKVGLDDLLIQKGSEYFKSIVHNTSYDTSFLELQQHSIHLLDFADKYDFNFEMDGDKTTFIKNDIKLKLENKGNSNLITLFINDLLKVKETVNLSVGTKKDSFVKRCHLDENQSRDLRSFLDIILEFYSIQVEVEKSELHIKSSLKDKFPISASISEKKRERALKLAKSPDLLFLIKQSLEALGLVGEALNGLLLFLALTSRLLNKPISIIIKGSSAAGKSYLVKLVLKLFPKQAYIELTGLSPKALIYLNEDFKHRFLIIYEIHGTSDDDYTEYLIRTLLSENMIRYAVVERNNLDGHETRIIEREGPTGLITTTTHPSIHDENETRLFSIGISETPDQTKNIKSKIASDYEEINTENNEKLLEDIINLQKILEPLPVRIPFAKTLADLTPDEPLRIRRDFQRILAVIEVSALLHQHTRDIKEDKGVRYIEARLEDYYIAKALLEEPLSLTIHNKFPQTIELVNAIEELYRVSHDPVLIKELRARLKKPKKTILRWLEPALDCGWIENVGEQGRGKPFKLIPGKFEDTESNLLPPVETLCEKFPKLAENFQVIDPITGKEIRSERS